MTLMGLPGFSYPPVLFAKSEDYATAEKRTVGRRFGRTGRAPTDRQVYICISRR